MQALNHSCYYSAWDSAAISVGMTTLFVRLRAVGLALFAGVLVLGAVRTAHADTVYTVTLPADGTSVGPITISLTLTDFVEDGSGVGGGPEFAVGESDFARQHAQPKDVDDWVPSVGHGTGLVLKPEGYDWQPRAPDQRDGSIFLFVDSWADGGLFVDRGCVDEQLHAGECGSDASAFDHVDAGTGVLGVDGNGVPGGGYGGAAAAG